MTIGIAVAGPMAGLAAFRALRAVETVGRGAISGFATFAAISEGGTVLRAQTQRGGALALWDGAEPPEPIARAERVGLMSSGPDRPEPLCAFVGADPDGGIVTGHRLPIMPGADGVVPIVSALERLAMGAHPQDATKDALAADPDADAGLIALDLHGRIAIAETPAVARRDDRGSANVHDGATGLTVGVLHNTIFPCTALAALAVSAALDVVAPADAFEAFAAVTGLPVHAGPRRLEIDDAGAAVALCAPAAGWRSDRWEGSPVRRGDPVTRDGRTVGSVVGECYALACDGVIIGARGDQCVTWRWVT